MTYLEEMFEQNESLRHHHTFGLKAHARWFATFDSESALRQILLSKDRPDQIMILGGGSNVVFAADYPGLVLHNEIKFINPLRETNAHVFLQVGAGVVWQDLVEYTLSKDWGGLENLSLIPGTVGAAPIQNIGAYGVEVKDVITSLTAMDRTTGKMHELSGNECQFGYRDSIFKGIAKDQFVITSVTFQLSKKPSLKLGYGAITTALEANDIKLPTIQDVSKAIIHIRQQKLPDPTKIGNAGSFFKNPIITAEQFEYVLDVDVNVPNYITGNQIKIPAGYLIEQTGWKGYRDGDIGVYPQQALVLVNYGDAHAQQLLDLIRDIKASVLDRYHIKLETEVNVWEG